MAIDPESEAVLISEGAYRLLLHLYPRRFRDEWGLHMSRTFRDHTREQYQRDGILGLFGLWIFTTVNVVQTALEERAQSGEWFMSKETLIRIGGPSMIFAGVLWIIGSIDTFNSMTWALLFPALIALLVGMLALNVYASRSSSSVVRSTSVLAIAVAGLALVGYLVGSIYYRQNLHDLFYGLFVLSLTVLFSSLVVVGVKLMREPLLPRWGGLPLLLNLPLAVYFLNSTLSLGSRYAPVIPMWVQIGVLMLGGIGLVLLGCAMLPLKSRASEPAGA